ncbi:thioredoxin [Alicyclobacillus sp. SO9]|uniref:thioredoxin n=1 Tax=Alicyclobacillus sp. SO9 TaxID=2665646 RepID=UPI0018E78FB2|nr:thioredoxin [Alicyclobacillus sp. SO9]QQE77381.1 thioredoxin [Alicyclobacillus sp. SO9]
MATQQVSDANFNEFINSEKPVLVDFWAEWCGPCKMLSPVIEEISNEYADKLTVGALDVDSNPRTAQQFGIMSIPTTLVFKNGEVVKQLVGYRPKNDLLAQLADVLS